MSPTTSAASQTSTCTCVTTTRTLPSHALALSSQEQVKTSDSWNIFTHFPGSANMREVRSYSEGNHKQYLNKRSIPESLPSLDHSDLHYSAYLRYNDIQINPRSRSRSTTSKKTHRSRSKKIKDTKRYKDDNMLDAQDNIKSDDSKSQINHNPFHSDFNKVIENPFLRVQEQSMTTEVTDVTSDDESGDMKFKSEKPREETAIVDIYDADESSDPFLKMRVSIRVHHLSSDSMTIYK